MNKAKLYLAVVLLHVGVLWMLNAALALGRLSAQPEALLNVTILPTPIEPHTARPAAGDGTKPVQAHTQTTLQAPLESEPTLVAQGAPQATPPGLDMSGAVAQVDVPVKPMPAVEPPSAARSSSPQQTASQATPQSIAAQQIDVHHLSVRMPSSTTLHYVVTKDKDSAKARLEWRVQAAQTQNQNQNDVPAYVLVYEASYFGLSLIKQVSQGRITTGGLVPVRFSDKRRGRSEQATHFEPRTALAADARGDLGWVRFSNNRAQVAWQFATQDRASFLLQLAAYLAAQPDAFVEGKTLELPVASVDELDVWTFEVQNLEKLELPITRTGESTPAIKFMRRSRRTFDSAVEVWFAPSYAYLPVRIRVTDSTGVTDAQLSAQD